MEVDVKKEYKFFLNEKIADVFIYLLAICNSYNIDLLEAFKDKEKNQLRSNLEVKRELENDETKNFFRPCVRI